MAKYQPAGNTTSIVEERPEFAKLPFSDNKPYLSEKAQYALLSPQITKGTSKTSGKSFTINLRQVVMTAQIMADEELHGNFWYYKAEVSFDMAKAVPTPYLSATNLADGPNRRHTRNPFPPGMKAGLLRRPDIIIVQDPAIRWPGRAATDHSGVMHADNLARVVEVKFPGDTLSEDQLWAYTNIAGGEDRLTILDVKEPEKKKQPQTKPVPAPRKDEVTKRVPAPIYSPTPIAHPGLLEDWCTQLQHGLAEAWDSAQQGLKVLSDETREWLKTNAQWLHETGRWVKDTANQAWTWVNEKGQIVASWTIAQLKAAWAQIEKYCDIAWNEIKQIQWGQILLDVGKVLAGILLAIGVGVLVVVTLPVELVSALLVILSIGGTVAFEAAAA